MKEYKRFNISFLAFTLPGLLSLGLFNIAIDPYGVFNSSEISELNRLKAKQFLNVRLFKAIKVTQIKPKTLLLGSSRTDLGLNPEHPSFAAQQPAYNLGLVGPNIYEVKRYLEHTLTNQPEIETVVLGLDLFMFNEHKQNAIDFNEDRLEKKSITLSDLLNITLSTTAIEASVETIKSNKNADSYYLYHPNGLRYVYQNKPRQSARKRFEGSINGLLNSDEYYHNYKLSAKFLQDFKDIVTICKDRNIELKVFISPSHASQWESLYRGGLWQIFEQWKRELVEITPVWDFSGYNSITTEAIDREMQNYWDSSHYRQEVGDLVIDRLFNVPANQVPKDFGMLITSQNIESHLVNILAARELWVKNNPETVDFIKAAI